MNVVRLWPEWGPRDLTGPLPISDELRLRLRKWNQIWQTVLDPVEEVRWPDAEVGRQWTAEAKGWCVTCRSNSRSFAWWRGSEPMTRTENSRPGNDAAAAVPAPPAHCGIPHRSTFNRTRK